MPVLGLPASAQLLQILPSALRLNSSFVFCASPSDAAISFAQAQYLVFSIDYEGFGLSAGLHAFIPRFDTLVEDVVEVTDSLQGTVSNVPDTVWQTGGDMPGAHRQCQSGSD